MSIPSDDASPRTRRTVARFGPPDDPAADLALVEGVRRGESGAIDAFVERLGLVRRVVSSKNAQFGYPLSAADIEDLVQDTLVAIWRKLDGYTGRGALAAWVYRFTYLELLARLRRIRRLPRVASDLGADAIVEPASRDPDHDLQEQVYRFLVMLGPPDADVLRLKHLEGLTFDEAAERLGASVNTMKSRYYRGLAKLRAMLEQEKDRPKP